MGVTNITAWSEQIPVSHRELLLHAVTAVVDNQEIILISGDENVVLIDASNLLNRRQMIRIVGTANLYLSIPTSILLLLMGLLSIFFNINWKGDDDEK